MAEAKIPSRRRLSEFFLQPETVFMFSYQTDDEVLIEVNVADGLEIFKLVGRWSTKDD